jgi:hypothetical protein
MYSSGNLSPNLGLIGNDGALKALRHRVGLVPLRIRFLWTTSPVRTSDNPPVKRRSPVHVRPSKLRLSLI